jgi:Xaa-Pro aminopeptidase
MSNPFTTEFNRRLQSLRSLMQQRAVDALIIPSSDPHLSEYLAPRWQGRQWVSGFTGSAGTLVIMAGFAGMWTDSRYWEQAEIELSGTPIELRKIAGGSRSSYIDWLAAALQPGQKVSVDGDVLDLATWRRLQRALAARDIALDDGIDLLDAARIDRPPLPAGPIFEHEMPFASTSRAQKLASLRAAMALAGANRHVISTLGDIAYLFNLRGADVEYNPVFLAHALIGPRHATIFIGDGKVAPALRARLAKDEVFLAPYDSWAAVLATLNTETALLLDPDQVTAGTRHAIPAEVKVIESVNPTTLAKSRKSAAEVAQVRVTMEQDGAALCEFFSWLEDVVSAPGYGSEGVPLSELDMDSRLSAARVRRTGYISPSFATIAGFNANGALIHYQATDQTHSRIFGDGLLLIDSGGQYLGGTTDVTRMVPVGRISPSQRRDCTLVLKGLIALSSAQFPAGAKAPMLDALARAPIWSAGMDYRHGTGHGVGFFLNVHEGPQMISLHASPDASTAMEEGMITSIEPGIYRPGRWGVRLENLVVNSVGDRSEFGDFLRFETLTLCPIDARCLEISLLRDDERAWLNDYHAHVRSRLSPLLEGAALAWLERRTAPV